MPRTPRPISARVRILAAVLAVAGVGLVIVGGVTFLVQRDWVLAGIDDRLQAQVVSLHTVADADRNPATPAVGDDTGIDELDVADYTSTEQVLADAVTRLLPGRSEAAAAILDGEPIVGPATASGFDIAGDRALVERIVADAAGAAGAVIGTAETPNGTLRYIAIPVHVEGDPRTGLYVRAIDVDAELETVVAATLTYTIAAVAVLLAIAVVGWFVTGRLLSPIRRLRETADSITLTELSVRLPAGGNDDIADLSRTVNSMLDRLEGSVDVQRQLLDDVRHELKTPITIVRGHLELMDPKDADDVASARSLGIAELDRMTRLVEDIDLLASVEGGSVATDRVDLAALTARVGELVAVIPGHAWRVERIAKGYFAGDHDRMLQAWLQLADNAAKYTPTGSGIELGSELDASGIRLWVRDHGAGIPPALRHRIFRRFDRAHGKRSVGGSGLGLAIVDAIAKAHAGYCAVTDSPGGGATFTVHLPLPASGAELPAPVRAGDVVLQREAAE